MRGRASPGAPVAARRLKALSNSTAIFARMHLPPDQYKCFIRDILIVVRRFKMKIIDDPKIELELFGLTAAGRSPEIPEAHDLYGWLTGSWDLDVRHYWVDVSARGLKAEVHAAWVLEGRAVQDVWIMPRRSDRIGEPD